MIYSRIVQMIGQEKINKLHASTVLVLGLGGVGGHVAESLARSGIGTLIIVDKDIVDESNMNRQIIALTSTLNQPKVTVMKERIKEINPSINVITYHEFYNFETKHKILNHQIDFICDCIDTITFKIDIIKESLQRNIPIISSMGTGNKLHPEKLQIADIFDTSYCPIARVIRQKLKKEKITGKVPVVYSTEEPKKVDSTKQSPSSTAFVPGTSGLIMAGYVVRKLIE